MLTHYVSVVAQKPLAYVGLVEIQIQVQLLMVVSAHKVVEVV
jgi:hypothetical protein